MCATCCIGVDRTCCVPVQAARQKPAKQWQLQEALQLQELPVPQTVRLLLLVCHKSLTGLSALHSLWVCPYAHRTGTRCIQCAQTTAQAAPFQQALAQRSSTQRPLLVNRYCECFASGRYCDGCNCVNCCNNMENEVTRQSAVEAILERNPNAFRPKIQAGASVSHPTAVHSANA